MEAQAKTEEFGEVAVVDANQIQAEAAIALKRLGEGVDRIASAKTIEGANGIAARCQESVAYLERLLVVSPDVLRGVARVLPSGKVRQALCDPKSELVRVREAFRRVIGICAATWYEPRISEYCSHAEGLTAFEFRSKAFELFGDSERWASCPQRDKAILLLEQAGKETVSSMQQLREELDWLEQEFDKVVADEVLERGGDAQQ